MLGKQKIELLPVELDAFFYYVCGIFLFSTFCNFLDKTLLSLEYTITGAFLLFDILLILMQKLRANRVSHPRQNLDHR